MTSSGAPIYPDTDEVAKRTRHLPGGVDDLDTNFTVEVKNGREFRREYKKGIDAFVAGTPAKSYVIYRGDRELEIDGIRVLPLEAFLRRLHAGEIIGSVSRRREP